VKFTISIRGAEAFSLSFSETGSLGAAKLLSVANEAGVAAVEPARAVVGDGRRGARLLASHDAVETVIVLWRDTPVSLRAIVLAVDGSPGVGFIKRVAHGPSLERFLGVFFGRAAHLVCLTAVRLLLLGPDLSREAVVLFGRTAGFGAFASTSVLVHSAEGLPLGTIKHLPAIHLGASKFFAVLDDAVIATVIPVFATLRELATTTGLATTALKFGVNLQKLLQRDLHLVMACCLLELRLCEFWVQ